MTCLVLYDGLGGIKGIQQGSSASLGAYAAGTLHRHLYSEVMPRSSTHYVFAGEIYAKGDRPSDGHIFDYSVGAWVFDVDVGKASKWADIKSARENQEFSTFVWNGFTFDCDEVCQRRIQGAVQLAALDTNVVMDWTLADNSSQTFNATELQQIGQALGAHVNACHVKARGLRDQINAAQTEAELSVISW